MTRIVPRMLLTVVLAISTSSSTAHVHIGVDTTAGNPGDQIFIRAGYYPAENAFNIDGVGRLREAGEVAVFHALDTLPQAGPFHSWYAGNEILLTSDFYFATGRLDGGDFRFELAAVTPISGPAGDLAWGTFTGGGEFTKSALSSSLTRAERSYSVGAGGHEHDQGYSLTGAWVQDLTVIAWDASGRYVDSDPVKIRFDNGRCPADVNREGGLTVQDIFDFLAAYFTGAPVADFDRTGNVTVQDIFDFLTAYFTGC